ncbi:MAG: hypothetical protein ACR2LK_00305 [Solirubrobacteraceae bacterium]
MKRVALYAVLSVLSVSLWAFSYGAGVNAEDGEPWWVGPGLGAGSILALGFAVATVVRLITVIIVRRL